MNSTGKAVILTGNIVVIWLLYYTSGSTKRYMNGI